VILKRFKIKINHIFAAAKIKIDENTKNKRFYETIDNRTGILCFYGVHRQCMQQWGQWKNVPVRARENRSCFGS
jgi:hypothetical protein